MDQHTLSFRPKIVRSITLLVAPYYFYRFNPDDLGIICFTMVRIDHSQTLLITGSRSGWDMNLPAEQMITQRDSTNQDR